jgi:O-antigen/teichoic acid export membrane protein
MLKGFFKDAGIYTMSNVLNKALPFLLLPVLTHYLAPQEYAIFVLVQVVMNVLVPFIGLNGDAASSRAFFVYDEHEFGTYVSISFYLTIAALAIFGVAESVVGERVAVLLGMPTHWLLLTILITAAESVKRLLLAIWQAQKKVRSFAFLNVSQTIVRFLLMIVPLLLFEEKLEFMLWGYASSFLLFAILSIVFMVREGHLRIGWRSDLALEQLRYGLPLVPHRVGGWLMGMADRVIIVRVLGMAEAGIYNVGYSFGNSVGILQDAFTRAWMPRFYEDLRDDNEAARKQIVSFILAYSLFMFLMALGMAVVGHLAMPLLDEQYWAAEAFIIWIALAYAFNGIYKMAMGFILFSGKTHLMTYITLGLGIFNALLSYTLVIQVGLMGAAYSAFVTQVLFTIVTFKISNRLYVMPWRQGLKQFPSDAKAGIRRVGLYLRKRLTQD